MSHEHYHPLVNRRIVEENIHEDVHDDWDPYVRDHQNRIIGARRPHGGVVVGADSLKQKVAVSVDVESAEFQRRVGKALGTIGRLYGPSAKPKCNECHFRNDAEFGFGHTGVISGPPDSDYRYVGVVGSAEYKLAKARRSAVGKVISHYLGSRGNDDEIYVHGKRGESVTFAGDLPELSALENAFDVETHVGEKDEKGLKRFTAEPRTPGEGHPWVPDEFYDTARKVESYHPHVRADYVHTCDVCGFEGTMYDLDLDGEHSDDATRVCPDCGYDIIFVGSYGGEYQCQGE